MEQPLIYDEFAKSHFRLENVILNEAERYYNKAVMEFFDSAQNDNFCLFTNSSFFIHQIWNRFFSQLSIIVFHAFVETLMRFEPSEFKFSEE